MHTSRPEDSTRRRLERARCAAALVAVILLATPGVAHAGGRLLATGGVTQVEGSAGGGLVPWAVIAGTGTEDEIGGGFSSTYVHLSDFRLESYGASIGFWNRAEFSFAHQRFFVRPLDTRLRMNVASLKVRLSGDVVYGFLPQFAAGVQYKQNMDFALPDAVGARRNWGIDGYLSATKLFLGGFFGYNLLLNGTVRATRANELGLLGFGGDRRGGYRALFEGSAAVFLNRRLAIGFEYRQKGSNLHFAKESDWMDWFIAWFPSKHLGLVASYARLGDIAGFKGQDGVYLSLQVSR